MDVITGILHSKDCFNKRRRDNLPRVYAIYTRDDLYGHISVIYYSTFARDQNQNIVLLFRR